MLRSTTITIAAADGTTNPRRWTKFPSTMNIERCCCLLIHLIILIIIYIRLEKLNRKQDDLIVAYRSWVTRSSIDLHRNLSKDSNDCSCQTIVHPKRNRTTHCLQIHVGSSETIDEVFCPNASINPWLIIQNRRTNSIHFNRTWNEYRRGFGHASNQSDFWIGNENLYWLTSKYSCRLKIELTDWYNETRIATYETFHVASQNDDYRLLIDGYHGNMDSYKKIDSFSRWHYNAPFSTYDHYATEHLNCPQAYGGAGWWYHFGSECAHVQLNGQIATHTDGLVPLNTGILWTGWKSDRHYSFQRVYMAIQRKLKRPSAFSIS